MLSPGARIGGFGVVERLSVTAMGDLVRARSLSTGQAALLRARPLGDRVTQAWLEGARGVIGPRPGCLEVLGVGWEGELGFVALEEPDGELLEARIDRIQRGAPPLGPELLGKVVALGLGAMAGPSSLHLGADGTLRLAPELAESEGFGGQAQLRATAAMVLDLSRGGPRWPVVDAAERVLAGVPSAGAELAAAAARATDPAPPVEPRLFSPKDLAERDARLILLLAVLTIFAAGALIVVLMLRP
ncbi:MAG: hypothetical protein U1E65_11595 [Myxococcota bacterium]